MLKWYEHIRKRPGMYIGRVNNMGYSTMMKGVFHEFMEHSEVEKMTVEYTDGRKGNLKFDNVNAEVHNRWGEFQRSASNPFLLDLFALNALSSRFEIRFLGTAGETLAYNLFEKGIKVEGDEPSTLHCSSVEVYFTLDETIWGETFEWNYLYQNEQLKEVASLNNQVKIDYRYTKDGQDCRIIHHFTKGLQDRIELELMNGAHHPYFLTYSNAKLGTIQIETAFSFLSKLDDRTRITSYVNDYFTEFHGSHVEGLLQGITQTFERFASSMGLQYDILNMKRELRKSLVALIQIRMNNSTFAGPTRSRLANPELIEPIAAHIEEVFYPRLVKNPDEAERLLRILETDESDS